MFYLQEEESRVNEKKRRFEALRGGGRTLEGENYQLEARGAQGGGGRGP